MLLYESDGPPVDDCLFSSSSADGHHVRVKVRLAARSPLTRPRRAFTLRRTYVHDPLTSSNLIPLIDTAEGVVLGDKVTKTIGGFGRYLIYILIGLDTIL